MSMLQWDVIEPLVRERHRQLLRKRLVKEALQARKANGSSRGVNPARILRRAGRDQGTPEAGAAASET